MRAIKIDATHNTLTVVEVEKDNVLGDIYRHGGFDIMEHMGAIKGNDVWGDQIGRLKGECRGFYLNGYLVCGNAVVLGHDGKGEIVGTTLTLGEVQGRVGWLPHGKVIDPGL